MRQHATAVVDALKTNYGCQFRFISLKRCKIPISKGANFAFKIIKKYTEINLYTKIKQNDTLIKKESFATP